MPPTTSEDAVAPAGAAMEAVVAAEAAVAEENPVAVEAVATITAAAAAPQVVRMQIHTTGSSTSDDWCRSRDGAGFE